MEPFGPGLKRNKKEKSVLVLNGRRKKELSGGAIMYAGSLPSPFILAFHKRNHVEGPKKGVLVRDPPGSGLQKVTKVVI